jgi:hypothetical protein
MAGPTISDNRHAVCEEALTIAAGSARRKLHSGTLYCGFDDQLFALRRRVHGSQ